MRTIKIGEINLVLVVVYSYLFLVSAECAKILGVFPAPGYSQFILAEALMKEVANRGHEVTVISAYRPKNAPANYKTILVEEVFQSSGSESELFDMNSNSLFDNIMASYLNGVGRTENTLKNKEVQSLLHSNQKFDLVIVEQFFNDALKGFAAHFEAPLILFSSMGLTEWNKCYMGIPALPSFHAITVTSHTNHMSFFELLRNIAGTVFDYVCRNFIVYHKQQELLEKYFPGKLVFDKIINDASLMLLNSHVTTSENVLLPYNVVEIGGFHVATNPLDQEMQKLLDGTTDGAVLFSLGTNLKSSSLSPETVSAIFKVFGKMKQKILWKFEKDFPNKPLNVYISKWLKQSDILAHPNVILFITHGGILSVTEAIYHGVPMVGIPVFGDQGMNIARVKRLEIATDLCLNKLSEETLSSAIQEIINNTKYKTNVKKISNLMKDRPVKPIDLAMYWIEYMIRHKGFRFETPGSNLYWFQVYMLDVLCFILFNLLILYWFIKYVLVIRQNGKCKDKQCKENIDIQKKQQ